MQADRYPCLCCNCRDDHATLCCAVVSKPHNRERRTPARKTIPETKATLEDVPSHKERGTTGQKKVQPMFLRVLHVLVVFFWSPICSSIYLCLCRFVCRFVCLSLCLSICVSVCLFVCLSVCLSVYHLPIYLSIHLSIYRALPICTLT